MAAVSTINLNDDLATPVNHAFAPAKTQSDYAMFEDRSAGVYIGFNKLTYALRRPKSSSASAVRNLKLLIKIETPKLEVVSNSSISGIAPAPTVSYRPVAELTITLPERCSLQDRKDLRRFISGVINHQTAIDAFEKFELPY